jgi:serine/threonine protein kinase
MKNSRYHILGEVGQGQFGKVFCGCDRTTGQLFALKSLDHLRFPTHSFLKELAILVRLNHPNIVSFHGVEYRHIGRYIIMDYCQGGTLRQLIESKIDLSLIQKLGLVQDALRGLEHIHQHRIIHCDLKPENILLDVTAQGWTAKIADFGIARFMGQPEARVNSSGDTGSPAYMAPERFYGRYSPESDLYAIGVLLYELVSGERPFSGMPIDVMKAHLNQPLRIPRPIPTLLKAIIRKALQKLPQHRYGSATEMRLVLETVITSLYHGNSAAASKPLEPALPLKPNLSKIKPSAKTFIRHLNIHPEQLQPFLECEQVIHRLWLRPQGCMIATQAEQGLHLWLQAIGGLQLLGTLPIPHPSSHPFPGACIDIDPQGQWLAVLHHTNPTDEPKSLSDLPQVLPSGHLKICRFSTLNTASNTARITELEGSPEQVWITSDRHLLIADAPTAQPLDSHSQLQRLRFWNRRGQSYWIYDFEDVIKTAVLSRTQDQLFAIAKSQNATGLIISLSPLKIKRIPLGVIADWICTAHWGYILGDRLGNIACLNRRGRTVAQAKLPLTTHQGISAAAFTDPATLLIATKQNEKGIVLSLDLSPYLPRSLLRL